MVRVTADPSLQRALATGPCPMPPATLAAVLGEHDLQSCLLRWGSSLSCDEAVAERVVSLARDLVGWYMWHEAPAIFQDPSKLAAAKRDSSSAHLEYLGMEHTSGFDSGSDDSDM